MTRKISLVALAGAAAAVLTVGLHADVKTTEKSTFKMEGFLGGFLNRAMGGSDGITSTLALKGNRMARTDANRGQIIDLSEEKVYDLDIKKKEYTVKTFAEMRAELEKVKADMEKQAASNPEQKQQAEQAAKELEFDVDVKATGQSKTIAGQETKESVLTITMREKGKPVTESGGMVMTSNLWLGPKQPALDELMAFNMKFVKAVYGDVFGTMDPRSMVSLSAFLPGFGSLMQKMGAEAQKLQGTPLATTTVFEAVKSAEQMKAASQQSGGGGIGGMLAGRLNRGASQQRTKTLTMTQEYLSIAPSASAEDVAIPAGFKEKR
jgi:hypothetical protein